MLEASIQFQIPIYQRTYDWTKQNCQQLYDDIMKSGKTKEEKYHFIGAITCVRIPTSISDNVKRYQLIDGQQRITSLMLLLRAAERQTWCVGCGNHGDDRPAAV